MKLQQIAIILAHAVVGWGLCFATIGIGMATTSENNALIIHAIAAPVFFAAISFFYFRNFAFTAPLQTGLIFLATVMALDFFVVSMLILRSFIMFTSILGSWIPFALIFFSTWLTGIFVHKRPALSHG
jgi:hypothetical protein